LDVVLKERGSSLFSWVVWVNKLDQLFLIKFVTLTGKPLEVMNKMIQRRINITCLSQT